jgi:hypothetical protein
VLIAGANTVARSIAAALTKAGFSVVLVDTRYDYTAKAREASLRVQYANVLSDYVMEEIDFGGLGRFFALTANDHVNTLAAAKFREIFGTRNVYQLANRSQRERFDTGSQKRFAGRTLFADDLNYAVLDKAIADGAVIKATHLTKQFSLAKLREEHPTTRVLFIVGEDRFSVISADAEQPKAVAGQTVIHIVLSPNLSLAPNVPTEEPAAKPKELKN